jgi:hypothetical protein
VLLWRSLEEWTAVRTGRDRGQPDDHMWALRNLTPYAADRNWTRDKDGHHWWIVAIRATFDLGADGRPTPAEEQLPPLLAPEYFGEPGKTSLRYDSDLLAPKPATDVLLVANAHAPGGRPAATVPVGLRVGAIQKQLLVHGERFYRSTPTGMLVSAPQPFTTRPIRYELAYGGIDVADPDPRNHRFDARNPIGRGLAVEPRRLVDQPAHSIEYANRDPAQSGPAGFGPIDPAWQPRLALAGTYDEGWARSKKPLLPDDFDPAYALSSPADQRLPQPLVGGERVDLVNMTPQGRLVFDLPMLAFACTSRFGARREPHAAQLATVLVEPDAARLSLVWQSRLRVPAPEADYLDETEIVQTGSGR